MIRKATMDDVSRIAEINVYGWRNTYKNMISDIILFKDLSIKKSIERYSHIIEESKNIIYVYEDENNGIVKGMMGFSNIENDEIKKGFELVFIYVEPIFCRDGIGTQMLTFFEDEGKNNKKDTFIIWVLRENKIGRSFYEKNGYKFDGSEKRIESLNVIDIRYKKYLN